MGQASQQDPWLDGSVPGAAGALRLGVRLEARSDIRRLVDTLESRLAQVGAVMGLMGVWAWCWACPATLSALSHRLSWSVLVCVFQAFMGCVSGTACASVCSELPCILICVEHTILQLIGASQEATRSRLCLTLLTAHMHVLLTSY